nr:hypothetical protein [Tanacetum cinerariifolium]
MKEGTKILATIDGIIRSVSESSLMRNLKLRDAEGISSLPDEVLFENLTLMGYNISPNQKFTFQKVFDYVFKNEPIWSNYPYSNVCDEPASPHRDVSQGEACPTDSGFIADQDRATIAKSSTLPYDSAPRVTSPAAVEGILASGVVNVPTGSGSIPTASTTAEGSVPTGSEEVPTASPICATAPVVTLYRRRKGKEVMVESKTLKK